MPKIAFACPICSVEKFYYPSTLRKTACSKKCAAVVQSNAMIGSNNPNYGKRWSADKKKQRSEVMKKEMLCEKRRHVAGNGNRGKKFNEERIQKMHANRDKESYSHPHSVETKKIIGELSSAKWTDEFKANFKQKMVETGYWIADKDKTDYEVYAKLANWVKPMWNLFEKVDHGVFNCRTNRKGSVRDHILTRLDGFELGIWPELLRHPANCQIISHSANSKKRRKSEQTYDELKQKIIAYDKNWFEQDICLHRIKEYDEGKRWKRKEVVSE